MSRDAAVTDRVSSPSASARATLVGSYAFGTAGRMAASPNAVTASKSDASDRNGRGDAWPRGGATRLDGGPRRGLIALDGDPQLRLSDRQIDRRSQGAAIAIRYDLLTDADVSADRVKVDGPPSDPQDGMFSGDARVPQDDVGT